MADDNKIQLDIEVSQGSIDRSFKAVDDRAAKSAEASAEVFKKHFDKQEAELKVSIGRIITETQKAASRATAELEKAVAASQKRNEAIYRASVKQNLDQALSALSGGNAFKKSAQESASVFEAAFEAEAKRNPIEVPIAVPAGLGGGATNLAAQYYLVKEAFNAAKVVAQELFNVIIEGENEIKLDKKFEILATQAGIVSDVLKNDLNRAVKGLVDEGELLQIASQSFVQLGNNAKALPQILDLARKTYKVFGGDVVANTEAISQAIFSGQTRQLKQLGILVDTTNVYKDYARSIGTVAPLLTEQQKQTALLNEVLRQGGERFKGITSDTYGAKDAFTRAKVAFKELNDEISIAASKNLGGFFSGIANAVADSVNNLTKGLKNARPAETIDEVVGRMEVLRNKVNDYKKQLEQLGTAANTGFGASLKASIQTAEQQLFQYGEKLDQMQRDQAAGLAASASAAGGGGVDKTSDEYIRRRQDFANKIIDLNKQVAQSEIDAANANFQAKQNETTLNALYTLQKTQNEQAELEQIAALRRQYADSGIQERQLLNDGIEAIEKTHAANKLKIDKQYAEDKKKIDKRRNDEALSATSTALGQIATLQQNATGELAEIGKAAAITKATIDGYVAVQNALAQVPYPFNFAAAALVGAAAAANVAKIAQTGGGGSAAFNPQTSSGGGVSGETGSPITEIPAPEDTQAAIPQTTVQLTINGNVLDRRETGLEIAQILEEQFAQQGLTIRGVS